MVEIRWDGKGNYSIPDFLSLEKWAEIRKKNKTAIILWETIKLGIPLAFATYAAFCIDLKKHPEMEIDHIFDAACFGFFLAFTFTLAMWCCMEANWLYLQKCQKILESDT